MKIIPKAFQPPLILSLVALLCLVSPAAKAAQSGGFTYTNTGSAIIITGNTGLSGVVAIPEAIEGLPVTTIAYRAFRASPLTSITIPDSVTTIGDQAFYVCARLTSITIPDNVTSMGDEAFSGCLGLTNVAIGNSVTSIGSEAFSQCRRLANITLGSGVTSIGYRAFSFCTNLTSMTIPNRVTSIGDWAFEKCTNLTNVTLGNSVTGISGQAFYWCERLASIIVEEPNPFYTSAEGVLFDEAQATLITCPRGKTGSYTIPGSVTTIGQSAFEWCASLTSITIPDSVTTIEASAFRDCYGLANLTIGNGVKSIADAAFSGCSSLTSITIPNSVTSIGDAFNGCGKLASIIVEEPNPFYTSAEGVLFDEPQTTLINFPEGKTGSYTIPGSVTSLGAFAFPGSASLTSVTIPNSVTSLGDLAFFGCTNLTSVTLGSSLTSIGEWAFYMCYRLASVTIPDSVTSLGNLAFFGCSSLANVTLGSSLTSIGESAFSSCSSLASVIIPNRVTTISASAFSSCSNLTSVTIGNSVTSIADAAFASCSRLPSITIPDSVTSLGAFAFFGCSSLNAVYFQGNTPDMVGLSVFDGAGNIIVYHLPGTTGWGQTFAGRPTALWRLPNPVILAVPDDFGVKTNQFGFRISWATNAAVVVEACANLLTPVWTPLATNLITTGINPATDGWTYFSDPDWQNRPGRFYRVRSR